MNTLTIVVPSQLVIIDGVSLSLDASVFEQLIADSIHAVQWRNGAGHVEYNNGQANQKIESIDVFKTILDAHAAEFAHVTIEQNLSQWETYNRESGEIKVDLTSLIKARREEVEQLLQEHLAVGVSYDGYQFEADANSQANITSAMQLAQNVDTFNAITWTAADNRLYQIDSFEQLKSLGVAIGSYVQQMYAVRNAHKNALNNLDSADDVLGYDVTTGWHEQSV